MACLVIIFFIANIILLSRIFFIKKEIKNIIKQVNNYNSLNTNKKIDIKLFDKDVENLAESINKHISIAVDLQISYRRSQEELKRTIANISHDLRTPLTSILGYVQMLKNKNINISKKVEYLEITEKRAKDLQNLLNDFFTLSLVESSDYELDLQSINLNNILCDTIAAFYDVFIENGIYPNINLPSVDIMVIGDVSATQRILENLMINIIKHTKESVDIKLEVENKSAILTIINDAGELTSKDVDLIFERFYRSDDSRGSGNKNTGLGLSIVSGLLDKMNGNADCKIRDGKLHIYCRWNLVSWQN